MRVVLMHNPTAGSGDHAAEDLRASIRKAGHEVVSDVSSAEHLADALRSPCDLVAVAGGDGTVGHAAEAMIGSKIPLAVIPLGTANNIARTIGSCHDHEVLIANWSGAKTRPFDTAMFAVDGKSSRFLECFGFGMFAETIGDSKRMPEREDPADTLKQHRTLVRALVATGAARHYDVEIDGLDRSGDYLLVEVMNVPCLGPRLALAPHADPHDGQLEIVLVAPRDRDTVLEYVDALCAGKDARLQLPILRARRATVAATDPTFHHDGHLDRHNVAGARRQFEVHIEASALRVLCP